MHFCWTIHFFYWGDRHYQGYTMWESWTWPITDRRCSIAQLQFVRPFHPFYHHQHPHHLLLHKLHYSSIHCVILCIIISIEGKLFLGQGIKRVYSCLSYWEHLQKIMGDVGLLNMKFVEMVSWALLYLEDYHWVVIDLDEAREFYLEFLEYGLAL